MHRVADALASSEATSTAITSAAHEAMDTPASSAATSSTVAPSAAPEEIDTQASSGIAAKTAAKYDAKLDAAASLLRAHEHGLDVLEQQLAREREQVLARDTQIDQMLEAMARRDVEAEQAELQVSTLLLLNFRLQHGSSPVLVRVGGRSAAQHRAARGGA